MLFRSTNTLLWVLAIALWIAPQARADFVGINAKSDPLVPIGDPVITPPLNDSDTLSVPVSMLFIASHSNWAGVGFTITYDPVEVSFLGLLPRAPYLKTNTPAAAPVSLPTLWHSAASGSGLFRGVGLNSQLADIVIHATGTTTGNNGDTDVRVSLPTFAFNIFHVTDTAPLPLAAGDFVYVAPGAAMGIQRGVGAVAGPQLSVLPALGIGGGVWIQLSNAETPVAVASAYYGTSVSPVGNIHVEHSPGVPGVPALTAAGLATLVAGLAISALWYRRRGA